MHVVFQSANKITAPLIARFPELTIPLTILVAELNFKIIYHQEELNEFVEYLMQNLNLDELHINLDSIEFSQALNIAVEQYFRLRIDRKKKIARKIFLECVKSPSPPQFPLERLNTTLQQISLEGIEYLAFLDKEIMPLRDADINHKLDTGNYPPPPQGETREWWYEYYQQTEPISPYISKWINEIYEPPELANETQAIEEKRQKLKQAKQNDLGENSIEMEQLGLIRYHEQPGGWGGGGQVYNLTRYGKAFKEFIPD